MDAITQGKATLLPVQSRVCILVIHTGDRSNGAASLRWVLTWLLVDELWALRFAPVLRFLRIFKLARVHSQAR